MTAPGDRISSSAPTPQELEVLRLLKYAVMGAFDPVVVHRLDGSLLWVNHAAAAAKGLTIEQMRALTGWSWLSLPEDAREARLCELVTDGHTDFMLQEEAAGATTIFEVHSRTVETDRGAIVVSVMHDITEKMRAEEMLREMAFHDPLTGLANRALLDDRLKLAIANAERHGDLIGVVFMDIVNFKPINDTYGHHAGDQVLRIIAERLKHALRTGDTVARLGGDEFVVLVTRIPEPDALRLIAEKLSALVAEPIALGDATVSVSASTGFALFQPGADDAHSLLMRADIAMYAGRRAGVGVADAATFAHVV